MSIHDSVPLLRKFLCACVLSPFCRVWLFAIPCTAACQAPLSMGIPQERILEWVAIPSSKISSRLKDWTLVSYVICMGRWFFTTSATWEAPNHSVFIILFLEHLLVWNFQKIFLPLAVLCIFHINIRNDWRLLPKRKFVRNFSWISIYRTG